MKIPVLDGPAKGIEVDCPELPQGFRPSGFVWTVEGEEPVKYRAYPIGRYGSRGQHWVLARDKYSVHLYIMNLRYRQSTVWRLHCRTDDGNYCFHHERSRRYHVVSPEDFWSTR